MGLGAGLLVPWSATLADPSSGKLIGGDQRSNRTVWPAIKAISNVFEVGGPEPAYDYVEALRDGRGFTVTQYGFCTYNDEVLSVIARIAGARPATPLRHFLDWFPAPDTDLCRMPWPGFPAAWRSEAAQSPVLAQACEAEAEIRIVGPSEKFARQFSIRTAIGLSIFYDTVLQHGLGQDDDSFPTILGETAASVPGGSSEVGFLTRFLEVRRGVLLKAAAAETREAWRQSVSRVDALGLLLRENPDLERPVHVKSDEVDVTIS